MKVYIVSTEWYSADQGEFPNTYVMIRGIYSKREDAVNQFSELYELNRNWSFGYEMAKIIEGHMDAKYIERDITEEVREELNQQNIALDDSEIQL